jgi:hypothetical protein
MVINIVDLEIIVRWSIKAGYRHWTRINTGIAVSISSFLLNALKEHLLNQKYPFTRVATSVSWKNTRASSETAFYFNELQIFVKHSIIGMVQVPYT